MKILHFTLKNRLKPAIALGVAVLLSFTSPGRAIVELAYAAIPATLYEIKAKSIDGQVVGFDSFKGKVVLVVNTASKCGFTPQYKDLEGLYQRYKERDFVVLGFPTNDFGSQDPGTDADIKKFCQLNYGVTFPMFTKGAVTGSDLQPVYQYITAKAAADVAGPVQWNFEKFLIDKNGNVRARFGSVVNPLNGRITGKVEELLKE